MSILALLLILVLMGVLLWAIKTYLPVDDKIKQLITVVVVVIAVILVLQAFGVLAYLQNVMVPRAGR